MEKQSKKLVHFLIELGGDADKQEKLRQDPDAVFAGYDLSDEEKGSICYSVLSGNAKHVQKHLSPDHASKYGNVEVNCL